MLKPQPKTSDAMNKETSTYLDCARFLAALTVMLCHIDSYMVVGVLPWVDHLGLEAVGVFFVLSGFVIGYATETREKDLRTYAINRAARLYSVVIPCLTATLVLDTIGIHFVYDVWYHRERFFHEVQHIALGFTFLSYSWLLPEPIQPGNDGPFWSLCYEVPFYVIFGTFWFFRGVKRWLAPVLAVLVFGPYVLNLLPLWLLGFGLYHLFLVLALERPVARGILIFSLVLWAGFESILQYYGMCANPDANIAASKLLMYGGGLCFAASLIGFRFSKISLHSIAGPARWLAGATFTLYLLHFPLAWLLNGLMLASPIGTWPPATRWVLLASLTLALALAAAQMTERRKQDWRRAIEHCLGAIERVFTAGQKLRFDNENQPLL